MEASFSLHFVLIQCKGVFDSGRCIEQPQRDHVELLRVNLRSGVCSEIERMNIVVSVVWVACGRLSSVACAALLQREALRCRSV